jgi:hypothetical protein
MPVTIGSNAIITTVAGNGSATQIGTGVSPASVQLYDPQAVAVDSGQDKFIADEKDNRVLEVNNSSGLITTIAGNGTAGFSGDGSQATAAELNQPTGVAVYTNAQSQVFVFIADNQNNRIREVNLTSGIITTVAGDGVKGYNSDGIQATAAELYSPTGVAVDASGNLYIADFANERIRKVNTTGVISTVAGNGTWGYTGDNGQATVAELADPWSVAVDSSGNLYLTEISDSRVREVKTSGLISTVVGDGTNGFTGDSGPASDASLNGPTGIALDAAGDLFIADTGNNRVREVNHSSQIITTFAGNGTGNFAGDNGQASAAELDSPAGVALDSAGDLFIADGSNRVREVNHTSTVITTFAGGANPGDGNSAATAEINGPTAVAVDSAGDIFIADTSNNRIREVNHSTGLISTIAGNGIQGYSGNGGLAVAAELNAPTGVAVDAAGDVFIADAGNNRIREINASTGVITTVAGNGTAGYNGEGTGSTAELDNPTGVAVDANGNLYIADQFNQRLRKVVLSSDTITTVAGNGTAGFIGDGTATAVELNGPDAVAVDSAGDVFIAEYVNQRIRELTVGGQLITVAGNGSYGGGYSGDNGPATAAELNYPTGIAVDSAGDLFIADESNRRIREVKAGVITTVVGNGTQGFSGDSGSPSAAELNNPAGVAVDTAGDLLIADTGNNRIREVVPDPWVMLGSGAFFGAGSTGLVWQNKVTGDVYLWNQQGTTVTKVALGYADPTLWNFIGVGNLDPSHPGNASILLQAPSNGFVNAWFVNNGVSAGFATEGFADPSLWTLEGCGNFDSGKDAVSDLLWVNQPSGYADVWIFPHGTAQAEGCGTMNPSQWAFGGIGNFDANNPTFSSVVWKSTTTGSGGTVACLVANGTYTGTIVGLGYADPTLWTFAGIGNFHSDATQDLLWLYQPAGLCVATVYPNGVPTAVQLGFADANIWQMAGVVNVTWNGTSTSEILWRAPSNGLVVTWVIENGTIVSGGQFNLGYA